MRLVSCLTGLLFLILCSLEADAQVRLPSIISDNMILQQKSKVALWGWAQPGEHVSISASWTSAKTNTVADASGKWKASITTSKAGGPYTIVFSASNNIEIRNVLLGEVWLASGQ